MYTNISKPAKVDKKNETIKVLVECDNTERLFIATFGLLDVAEEMEEIFNASEPNYREMPEYQDLAYHLGCNDNITAIENLLDSDYQEKHLTPYYEPKNVKVYVESEGGYIRYVDEAIKAKIETYGFVELSDFDENVIFEY